LHLLPTITLDDDSVISGNRIEGNDSGDAATYDGIYCNSDNCVIVGNRCKDNDRYEINVGSSASRTLVSSNHCYGTDHAGAINDDGASTTSIGNIVS
jgi:hypothetical protein